MAIAYAQFEAVLRQGKAEGKTFDELYDLPQPQCKDTACRFWADGQCQNVEPSGVNSICYEIEEADALRTHWSMKYQNM